MEGIGCFTAEKGILKTSRLFKQRTISAGKFAQVLFPIEKLSCSCFLANSSSANQKQAKWDVDDGRKSVWMGTREITTGS